MIDDYDSNAYELLYQQNEELELMLQSQSDEIEKLQKKLELEKFKVRKLRQAGRAMHDFMEEMIMNDMYHDDIFNKAQKATGKWADIIEYMASKPKSLRK